MRHELKDDKPHEECGLFGIYSPGKNAARPTFYGLYTLQHRGQESAGIAVSDGDKMRLHKDSGLVGEVFNDSYLEFLKGDLAIGHVRYSTTGDSTPVNAQPMLSSPPLPQIGLAHNGNLINTVELREFLKEKGISFSSQSDSEVILKLLTYLQPENVPIAVKKAMEYLNGSYALVIMTKSQLIGVRDPLGMRPLCLGKLDNGYVLASESCALDAIGAEIIRDIKPGEIVVIDKDGLKSFQVSTVLHHQMCIFEYIYLARQDSIIEGRTVNLVRRAFGKKLAEEYTLEADLVLPIPASGVPAALGYSEKADLPFQEGLTKNHYVGRTFIQPQQNLREEKVRLKFNPIRDVLKGKRIVLVDDSIVRGTTCRQIVKMLKNAGAAEIHLLVSSPPVRYPCYYGVDTAREDELLAARHNLEDSKNYLGVDSLYYLSLEGLLSVLQASREEFCKACFDGNYPLKVSKILPDYPGDNSDCNVG